MFVGNNWDGTADVIKSTRRLRQDRPDQRHPGQGRAARRDLPRTRSSWPTSSASATAPARGTTSSSTTCTPPRTAAPLVVSRPELRRRRLHRPGHRRGQLALPRVRLPRRPHGGLPRRHPGRGLGLHLQHRARAGHQHRPAARLVRHRRQAARERLHRRRPATSGTCRSARSTPPSTTPWLDWTKGDRRITVVDATTFQQVQGDRHAGPARRLRPQRPAPTRSGPAAFTPDESKLYFQVSFFNGFLEYDVATDRITRVKTLPKNPATSDDRTTWVNDSRHHGMSMNPDGTQALRRGHHGRLRDHRRPRDAAGGPAGHRLQAVLGHRQRRRPGLRDLRERRRPGHARSTSPPARRSRPCRSATTRSASASATSARAGPLPDRV